MRKKNTKRKMKKEIKILIIIVIFILLGSSIYLYSNIDKNKLKRIGYNNIETKEILNLSQEEINNILKYDYNKDLIYIIESNDYNKDKLDLYLKYTSNNKDIEYLKIFNLINTKNINTDKLDEYIKLLKQFDNVDGIIKYVDNYSNSDIEVNETTLSFITEKYFIIDYLDRYLNYYENNKDLSFSEIITRINSNLDYDFYKDSNPADLSKGMYTLVNKYYYLDINYIPEDLETVGYAYAIHDTKLNKVALENFKKMAYDIKKEGLTIKITTAYRDYNFQSVLYNNYVNVDGKELADTYSARPGYSEHQFGYSFDLTNAEYSNFGEFEYTKEYEWLQKNAYKYGFIMRYPKDKEYITGYQFESWHYRYVGVDIATYIHENNITYEEYYAYYLR